MSPELVFSVANAVALLAWLLLILLPGRRWATAIVTGTVVPALFAILYVGLVVTELPGAEGSFATLGGVASLFNNPWVLLAGWVHYLAFDLLIGTWEVQDARERRIPHVLVVPCLILTFMLGPAGWLAYMTVRMLRTPRTPHAAVGATRG